MAKNGRRVGKMQVAGYCRVSTVVQSREGISMELQREVVRKQAVLWWPDCEIDYIEDVGTGTTNKRPGYTELKEMIRLRKVSAVIAWDHTRLARNAREWIEFLNLVRDKECALVLHNMGLCTSTPVGRMVLQFLGNMAEFESAQLSERMKEMHRQRKASGRVGSGFRPFGWKPDEDGRLQQVDEEQKAICLAISGISRGRSWGEIVLDIRSLGVKPVRGGEWTPQKLRGCIVAARKRLEEGIAIV